LLGQAQRLQSFGHLQHGNLVKLPAGQARDRLDRLCGKYGIQIMPKQLPASITDQAYEFLESERIRTSQSNQPARHQLFWQRR
jgi:hypothetical protein